MLALGRRSNLPVISMMCTLFIEFIRGVPLITLLFFGMVMLPLFLPEGVNMDGLARVLVAVTLFQSARYDSRKNDGHRRLQRVW